MYSKPKWPNIGFCVGILISKYNLCQLSKAVKKLQKHLNKKNENNMKNKMISIAVINQHLVLVLLL